MCGICGVWGNGGQEIVETMVSSMRHRGPDDRGTYAGAKMAIGMARLSVLDLSAAAHQPMSNPDGTVWIVFNGEAYNYQSERRLLEETGYQFSSRSDTEVVLRMYEHYGDDFMTRIRGMFAFAIYDLRQGERMLLARDQFGMKPLLYARTNRGLVFASEVKALLASGLVQRQVDPVALRQLLTFGSIQQPRTVLQDVKMLPPAHRLVLTDGTVRVDRYWSLATDRREGLRQSPYQEQVEEMTRVLDEAVRLQMVSDVPLGAFLSGGVDSSTLVAMMSKEVGHRLKTYSVGFEAEGADIDESEDARRTAEYLQTDHAHVLVTGTQVRELIFDIVKGLDQPTIDGVNAFFVSLAARQGVTVAISGTGGDELFAGYPWFLTMLAEHANGHRRSLGDRARSILASFSRSPIFDGLTLVRGGGRLVRARTSAGFLSRYATKYQIFNPRQTAKLLSPALRFRAQAGRAEAFDLAPTDELRDGTIVERVSGLSLRGYMNNQLLRDTDVAASANSLEVRLPFLDPLVVDTVLSLPDEAKISNTTGKHVDRQVTYRDSGAKRILIDLAGPLLPKDFDLQPKRGFAMPFGHWMRGPLNDVFMDALAGSSIRHRGLLNEEAVVSLRDEFLAGRQAWPQPWLLMVIELWCRSVLDVPSAS
jgi:asparagine synthase (glutamine-hydrolysing)